MVGRSLDSNQLRRRIDEVLRTDADFNAFCLDYFPEVYQRFGGKMERVEKVNLLFQLIPHRDQILDRLAAYSGGAQKTGHGLRMVPVVLVTVGVVGAIVTVSYFLWISQKKTQPPVMPTASTVIPSLPISVEPKSENVITNSPTAKMSPVPTLPPPPVYRGVLLDGKRKQPIKEAFVVLLGTSCHTETDQFGVFKFEDCDIDGVSRIQHPHVKIEYRGNDQEIVCNWIPLLALPAITRIDIWKDCKSNSRMSQQEIDRLLGL